MGFNLAHNVKRAILALALITVLAYAAYGHETEKQCYIARMDNKHVWLEPKACKPQPGFSKNLNPPKLQKQPSHA